MAVAVAVGALGVPASSSSASEERTVRGGSTPELIEAATARGDIGRARADLYLAWALGTDWRRVPARLRSAVPWDGTLPLLRLQERVKGMPPGPARAEIREALGPTACDVAPPEPDVEDTAHFHIHYNDMDIEGGLSITEYAASLEIAWTREVDDFGWAAPPLAPASLYPVVIEDLAPGLYGFVMATAFVGDNPNTPAWNEGDSIDSCMVLNEDYTGFPSPPEASLNATTAHEFNHSIQFGYGVLLGLNTADGAFVEGGATWMEDEVFDEANDNYFYLWPDFAQSMGQYNDSPYPYWIVFRALTERFGTGAAGGGEQVMQDFWEEMSRSAASNQFPALRAGLGNKGTNLPDAFHEAAIAIRLGQACGGAWAYPYCLEENAGYAAVAGPFPNHGAVASGGASFVGSVQDDYAVNWVTLPAVGPYPVTLANTSQGGSLRATVACVTGAGPKIAPLPASVGAGAATTVPSFDPAGCTGPPVAVITNQSETSANPNVSASRSYELFLGLQTKTVNLKAKPRKVDRGDRTKLRAKVLPCPGHEGDVIRFFRKKKKIATKKSNGSCVAKVKVKVKRTSVYRAVSPQQDDDHLTGTSKKVKVRVRRA